MILDATGHIRPVFSLWLPLLFAVGITVGNHTLSREGVDWLYSENGLSETIQYLIAFAAVIVGAWTLSLPGLGKWLCIWIGLATLGCFYIGMEEISWGQQFFNWETTGIFADLNDQNETNLHNTSSWFDQKPRLLLMVGIIVGGLILPVVKKYKPAWLPSRFQVIYPSADLKWVALLTMLSYLSKVFLKITGLVIYDRPSEINEVYIYYFMLLYLVQLRHVLRKPARV